MATQDINDINTRVVKFNGDTVNKIILNEDIVWAVRPPVAPAVFNVSIEQSKNYTLTINAYQTSGRRTIYPVENYGFVVGTGAQGSKGSVHPQAPPTSYHTFTKPTLTNRGQGYYAGREYFMYIPSTVQRTSNRVSGLQTFRATTMDGGNLSTERKKIKFVVDTVNTPLGGIGTSTSGPDGTAEHGTIRTFSMVKYPHYKNNFMFAWQGRFRRGYSKGLYLSNENPNDFTVSITATTPSYDD